MDGITYVGLDVHLRTIHGAVVTAAGEDRDLGVIAHTPKALHRMLTRINDDRSTLRVAYEAGPTGYTIARQLSRAEIACIVVAPSLIPKRAGDRVKTDRRDARNLARLLRSDALTAIAVPSEELEALRDLSRAREGALRGQHRLRQQLLKFLHRQDFPEPAGIGRWSVRYDAWLATLRPVQPAHQVVLADHLTAIAEASARRDRLHEAPRATAVVGPFAAQIAQLQTLFGIGPLTAIGLTAELGDLRRFAHPRDLMSSVGVVPSEHSSGKRVQRGAITKTGNAHVRWLITEAAWHNARHPPPPGTTADVAARARNRLFWRYRHLCAHGKPPQVAVIGIARELLGFVWEVTVKTPA